MAQRAIVIRPEWLAGVGDPDGSSLIEQERDEKRDPRNGWQWDALGHPDTCYCRRCCLDRM
jgi:hypothetical protein